MTDVATGRAEYATQTVNVALAQADARLQMIREQAAQSTNGDYPLTEQVEDHHIAIAACAQMIARAERHLAGDPSCTGDCEPLQPVREHRHFQVTWTSR